MTIEANPLGVACNLSCPYCYQTSMRTAGNVSVKPDISRMKAALERAGGQFSVFGGEPLLTPLPVLEELFAFGYSRFGQNGIQTNGSLITAQYIELFRRYRVHVGMSMDGPADLNDSRWAGSLERTREATRASTEALQRLCEAGNVPSLIVTLYRGNAGTPDLLLRLIDWFQDLEELGVRSVRLHLLEVDSESVRRTMSLTDAENLAALTALYEFQGQTKIRFDLFSEMAKLLMGDDEGATCVWNACDPYTTVAVQGVNGQGEQSNCGRTNKDGVDWRKAGQAGFERQIALWRSPQNDLGCQGCRFFFACKGQCPGTAVDGDWRNRTEHCAVWKGMFARIEKDLLVLGRTPLTVQKNVLTQVERILIHWWERGRNVSVASALRSVRTGQPLSGQDVQQHGDHWDAPDGHRHTDGPNVVHGDAGVTEYHGDSDMKETEHASTPRTHRLQLVGRLGRGTLSSS